MISSEVAHRRFHPSSLGFHPAKQDFIKFIRLAGIVLSLQAFLLLTVKYNRHYYKVLDGFHKVEILLGSQVKFLFEGAEKVGVVRESTSYVYVSYGQALLNQFLGHKQAFFQDITVG